MTLSMISIHIRKKERRVHGPSGFCRLLGRPTLYTSTGTFQQDCTLYCILLSDKYEKKGFCIVTSKLQANAK